MKKHIYLLLVGIAISITAYSQTTTDKPVVSTNNDQSVSLNETGPRGEISFNSEKDKAHRIATIERRIKAIEARMQEEGSTPEKENHRNVQLQKNREALELVKKAKIKVKPVR